MKKILIICAVIIGFAFTASAQTDNKPETFTPGDLTSSDEKRIDRVLNNLVGSKPISTITVNIFYNGGDINSLECATQLKKHLTTQGYFIYSCSKVNGTNDPGFEIRYSPASGNGKDYLTIYVGSAEIPEKYIKID